MRKEFRLESIELYNVFNYRGKNSINFSTEGDGNVFLFNIKNGGGKTSLFLGIKWGFYGFESGMVYTKDGVQLKSKDFMNQDEFEEGRFYVKIRFEYDGEMMELRRECPNYQQERTVLTLKTRGIIERDELARTHVSQMIPPDYGDFFMFNGEVLQEIANNQKDRFKTEGVLKLMGLKQLDDLKGILVGIQRAMTNELSRSANSGGKMADLQTEVQRLDEKRERLIRKQEELSRKLDDLLKQIWDLEERRRSYGDIESTMDKLSLLRQKRGSLEATRDSERKNISQTSEDAYLLFIGDDIKDLRDRMKNRIGRMEADIGSIPRSKGEYLHIQKEILSRHLEACPVCRSILTDDILAGLDDIISSIDGRDAEYAEKVAELNGLKSERDLLVAAVSRIPERLGTSCDNLYDVSERIIETDEKINRIEDVLANSEMTAIKEITDNLRDLYREKSRVESAKFENEKLLANTEKNLNIRRRDLTAIAGTGKEHVAMARRLEYLSKLISKLEIIISSVSRSKRHDILARANDVFMSITNKPDVYRGLEYDRPDSFSMHIVMTDGKTVPHPSSGEKHVMAISFLVSLSLNTERLNPMMMDTPLSRLDPVHKANIGRTLASLDNQALFLAQPGEMDADTMRMFLPSVVKMYESRPSEGNQACIVEVDL